MSGVKNSRSNSCAIGPIALAACTVITLRMYAERKQWPVTAVHANVHYVREGDKQHIDRVLTIEGTVDDEQKKRMADIAERTPVTLTLTSSPTLGPGSPETA